MRRLGGGTRTERLRDWLAGQRSPLVSTLRLHADGDGEDEGSAIQVWERAEGDALWLDTHDPDAVAHEVTGALQGLASETESVVRGSLVWLTQTGAPWTRYPVRCDPPEGMSAQRFEGNAKSFLVQAQRHTEAQGKAYFEATSDVLEKQGRVTELLTRLLETQIGRSTDMERELAELRDENAELRGSAATMEGIAEQATEQAEEAARAAEEAKSNGSQDQEVMSTLAKAIASNAGAAPKRRKGKAAS